MTDQIPAMLHDGERVWPADAIRAMGASYDWLKDRRHNEEEEEE